MPPHLERPEWVLTRRREIGHHIARARAASGMSIDQLAAAAGTDRAAIIRAENAQVSTGVDLLLMIAAGLGVPLANLVADTPMPPRG